ncbi:hypothetical protein, partial [Rhodovulum sulfidophilum]|uniref:hypothetical protein n=1 Tax=Rhodovulum sulfidophilum TaxID=35806 RepID=UPI001F31220B
GSGCRSASLVGSCSIGQADVRFCDSSTGNGKGRRTAAIGSKRVLEAVGFFETVQSFGNLSLLA